MKAYRITHIGATEFNQVKVTDQEAIEFFDKRKIEFHEAARNVIPEWVVTEINPKELEGKHGLQHKGNDASPKVELGAHSRDQGGEARTY
jgi:hypothetical protein